MFIDQFRTQPKIEQPAHDHNPDSQWRSLAKAISWRVTGSLDTIMLAWFFTSEISVALSIGLTEVVTKVVLYYFHERAWTRISLGKKKPYACTSAA
jgi:uncharacterized membrane protein